MDEKRRLPLWAAAAAKDMKFVLFFRKPRIKVQRSGFDSEKEEQGSKGSFRKKVKPFAGNGAEGTLLCSHVIPNRSPVQSTGSVWKRRNYGMDEKRRLPLWAAAAAKDMKFVLFFRKPRIKVQRSGFDSEKEEQGSEGSFREKAKPFAGNGAEGTLLCSQASPNRSPVQSTGSVWKRRSKGAKEVFGKRRSLLPETELSGLCSVPKHPQTEAQCKARVRFGKGGTTEWMRSGGCPCGLPPLRRI